MFQQILDQLNEQYKMIKNTGVLQQHWIDKHGEVCTQLKHLNKFHEFWNVNNDLWIVIFDKFRVVIDILHGIDDDYYEEDSL